MKVSKLVEDNKILTFKQIVQLFASANTEEDFWNANSQIDKSFQNDKISWNDHELLYNLSDRVGKGLGIGIKILNR